ESENLVSTTGIMLDGLRPPKDGQPVVVKNARIRGFGNGFEVHGVHQSTGTPMPCSRLLLRDNYVSDCQVGLWAVGRINDMHILGNRWSCMDAGVRLDKLLQGSGQVLIANNSIRSRQSAVELIKCETGVTDIIIRNNV